MLPGLRFLFAASILTASLLVFGMGAIALLRASHQQVVNLSAQPAPEPVFAQAPQSVPSLSMLRTDAAVAEAAPVAADAGRLATLTGALREPDALPAPVLTPEPPPPVTAEPQPAAPAPPADARSEIAPEPEILTLTAPAETAVIATAPETQPPALPAPEITGSTPQPGVAETAKPLIAVPPLPHARPEAANQVAALTPAAPTVTAAKKSLPMKRRYVRRVRERLAPATSANPLSTLFGGGN